MPLNLVAFVLYIEHGMGGRVQLLIMNAVFGRRIERNLGKAKGTVEKISNILSIIQAITL